MGKQKKKKLLYFYFNGDLHKALHANRPADILTAWNYPKGKMMKYSLSLVLKEGGRAFTSGEVMRMLGRSWNTIVRAIDTGAIHPPQKNYTLDEHRRDYAFKWSEDDVMALHSYLKTVHRGRPRKDGKITSQKDLPNAAELRAMMRQNTVLYVKNESGKFVPTWEAQKF